MKKQPLQVAGLQRLAAGILLALGMVCAPAGGADPSDYLHEDATITGQAIHNFKADGQAVSVIRGDFRMTVGERTVTGNDAVVWIETKKTGNVSRHAITVYVEGDAHVTEPGGSKTSDSVMLVKAYVQGEVTATGKVSSEPQESLPLYKRALEVRGEQKSLAETTTTDEYAIEATPTDPAQDSPRREDSPEQSGADEQAAPPEDLASATGGGEESPGETVRLEDLLEQRRRESPPVPTTRDTSAVDRIEPVVGSPSSPPSLSRAIGATEEDGTVAAPGAKGLSAVYFEALGGITIQKDPEDPTRRILVAKDNVLLTQGDRDSFGYIAMQAQSAVVFSRTGVERPEREELVPNAPPLMGMGQTGETVTGVYLEGDVRIMRGERRLEGQAAYYDFVTEKALILQPVLRTVQEQRNIPVYIRASKARILSPRETAFYDAIVSTSEFKTPTYHLGAKKAIFRDDTPYDKEGQKLSEKRYSAKYTHGVWAIRGIPLFWTPGGETDFEEGSTALRKVTTGSYHNLGIGLESQWHLFRLLGIVKPKGVNAYLNANAYEEGVVLGTDIEYQRQEGNRQYSGYDIIYGVMDRNQKDTFGDERKVETTEWRGRVLARHKEFLPGDWQIQGELSLISDRTFLESYFKDEFWTGKEQENLIYAKKQRDNWAITTLLKTRLNHFLTQSESYPDVAGYLIGQPLWSDLLTYYGEARLGAKRYHEDDDFGSYNENPEDGPFGSSDVMARFDTRHELNLPLQPITPIGPVNVVPFVAGRISAWSDSPGDNHGKFRPFVMGGVRSNMHFWRVYPNVESRLWDVHNLKHIITPEMTVFSNATGGTEPHDLFPMDPEVEQNIYENNGMSVAIRQRLQTKRGPAGNQQTVDWMRFNVEVGAFSQDRPDLKGDGRMFFSRPEYSLMRDFINADYMWQISDSTALLADMNYDLGDGQCDLMNVGLAVERDPRLSYYAGLRYIHELDSSVGTIGAQYKINRKYTISAFEQYDFRYNDGVNLGSRISITRKLPRWYVRFTFTYDRRYAGDDDIGLMISLWPEGVPEVRLGGGRMSLLNQSDKN